MFNNYQFLFSVGIFVVTTPISLFLLRKCFYKSKLYGISLFEKTELNQERSLSNMHLSMIFILFQLVVGLVSSVIGVYLFIVNRELAVGFLLILVLFIHLRAFIYFGSLSFNRADFEKYVASRTDLPANVIHVVNKMRTLSYSNLEHLKNYRHQPVIGIDHTKQPSKFPLYEELLVMNTKLSDLDGVDTTEVVQFTNENEEFITSLIKILESESLVLKLSTIESKDILNALLNTLINMNSELDVIIANEYDSEDMEYSEDYLSEIDADESMFNNLDMLDLLDVLDTFDSSDYGDSALTSMGEAVESLSESIGTISDMIAKIESDFDKL